MAVEYLVEGTNQMYKLLYLKPEPTPSDVYRAMHVGCQTLSVLSKDQLFFQDIAELPKLEDQYRREYRAIISDVNRFTSQFIDIETKTLVNAGLDPQYVRFLLEDAKQLRDIICNSTIRLFELRDKILDLQTLVCRNEERIRENVDREGGKNKFIKMAKSAALGVTGVTIVAVNVTSMITTAGALTPLGIISSMIGTVAVEQSAEHILSEEKESDGASAAE